MKSYSDLFNIRGSSYDFAMRLFPHARDEEFLQMINTVKIKNNWTVADIFSGGGYLKKYLSPNIKLIEYEPCVSFHKKNLKPDSNINFLLPFENKSVDASFSLAGLHHIENKIEIFNEVFRICKDSANFVISDVVLGSNVSKFLDNFVGSNNSTGHEGAYLSDQTLRELELAGWTVMNSSIKKFFWKFSGLFDLVFFAKKLFDINQASFDEIEKRLKKELGVEYLDDGKIGLHWELMTIQAKKIIYK